ncbi:MAG TPA: hypothetical protein VLY87_06800 [Flavobacterium sp.]|nr:hypothetical protein [Flavobacterium sp.]
MRVYEINWSKFINDLLLIELRKPSLKAFLNAVLKPIKNAHADFLAFRLNALYRVQHNSQIVYMEAVLNDEFDKTFRRIRIQNVKFRDALFFYEPLENKEVFFYDPADMMPKFFYNEDDFSGNGVDFVVCVPPILRPNNPQDENALLTKLRGLVDYYKLYAKNYDIQWVQIND